MSREFLLKQSTKKELIEEVLKQDKELLQEKAQNQELLDFLELVKKANGILGDITVELIKNDPDKEKVLALSDKLHALIEPFDKENQ